VRTSGRAPLVIASLGLAVAVVLIIAGVRSSVTGRAALGLPDAIESTDPIRSSVRVPAQTSVFVDLESGYTGVLVVDGLELTTIDLDEVNDITPEPGQQVEIAPVTRYERGNATLTFTPSEGAPIEEFSEGRHTVTVLYWKLDESRDQARSYTWEFTVF
jgi:hypothetical protein